MKKESKKGITNQDEVTKSFLIRVDDNVTECQLSALKFLEEFCKVNNLDIAECVVESDDEDKYTEEELIQTDAVDNAAFNLLQALAVDELRWDIRMIMDIVKSGISILKENKIEHDYPPFN